MERVGVVLVLGMAAALSWRSPAPASAADPPLGTATSACHVDDPRIAESSGAVEAGGTLYTVNDGGANLTLYALDAACGVAETVVSTSDPYDVEDLARSVDGTMWFADIGDNGATRATVALHAVRPDGSTDLYRLRYPDGAHDAEALLLDAAGRPFLVTKDPTGHSGVYAPTVSLSTTADTPLTRVAELTFAPTGTPGGPIGSLGALLVTGGAVSVDGTRLALRTYTDAYIWEAPDGDVLAALARTPTRIALPAAPQGEAVTFGSDGQTLLVTSEGIPFDVTQISAPAPTSRDTAAAVPPSTGPAASGAAVSGAAASVLSTSAGDSPSPLDGRWFELGLAAVTATFIVWLVGWIRRR